MSSTITTSTTYDASCLACRVAHDLAQEKLEPTILAFQCCNRFGNPGAPRLPNELVDMIIEALLLSAFREETKSLHSSIMILGIKRQAQIELLATTSPADIFRQVPCTLGTLL
ncbi:hypothetical protein MBLNU457_g2627t2 [Dothideomycetes sp. NU457]